MIKLYKGDYRDRQEQAIADGCDCYIEHHFNSFGNWRVNYGLAIYLPSQKYSFESKDLAALYSSCLQSEVSWQVKPATTKTYARAVNSLEKITEHTPAILIEPCFISKPEIANKLQGANTSLIMICAYALIMTINNGGYRNVGISIGHKYKTSRPNDRGANSVIGFDNDGKPIYGLPEAEIVEQVINKVMNYFKENK